MCGLFAQVLGDDLFVMPTLDEPGDSYEDAALTNGTNDSSFARGTSAPSLPEIDFDAGLNMCGTIPMPHRPAKIPRACCLAVSLRIGHATHWSI